MRGVVLLKRLLVAQMVMLPSSLSMPRQGAFRVDRVDDGRKGRQEGLVILGVLSMVVSRGVRLLQPRSGTFAVMITRYFFLSMFRAVDALLQGTSRPGMLRLLGIRVGPVNYATGAWNC